MCGRRPDNHHAVAVAVAVAAALPAVSAEEMGHGRRPGKEEEDREFEEEFLRFSMMEDEDEDDDDDDDEEEEIIAVSPPCRPPAIGGKGQRRREESRRRTKVQAAARELRATTGGRGAGATRGATRMGTEERDAGGTSAVESVTNFQARTPLPNPVIPVAPETGGDGNKAKHRAGGSGGAKRPAAKKARSQHGFHGVHRRTYGRWAAEIRDTVIKGCRVWVGTYDTAEEAALAYDAAARRIYGRNARTNFPATDDGERRPPPAPAPVAKPCSSSKRPKTRRSPAGRGDHGAATPPPPLPPPVVPDGIIDLLADGDPPAPAGGAVEFITLGTAAALEVTDGWEFEPFIQELLLLGGGVAPLDYYGNGQEQVARGGDLWSY